MHTMKNIHRQVATLVLSLAGALAVSGGAVAGDISNGYVAPVGKQGINDVQYSDAYPGNLDARYQKFTEIGLSSKIYNVWWSGLESSTPSSSQPINCPNSYQLVPANNAERVAQGYHRYRCLSSPQIAQWDRIFRRDADNGIQSAVVLWSSPTQYRYPSCNGFAWDGGRLYEGCVPRNDAMEDWEDYVNFLANRYRAGGEHGKISHFVIWNEAASGGWFDYSPVVRTNTRSLSDQELQTWIEKYVNMMKTAHRAIGRHTSGVLMHASLDKLWQNPGASDPTHIGSKILLDGIWARLGTSIDWSVAIHPYGDPVEEPGDNTNFQNVAILSGYQRDQLAARGVSDPQSMPQFKFIASEQGWQRYEGLDIQARNICEAHAISSRSPSLIAQMHNYFQELQVDNANSYGLVPLSAGRDLGQADGVATFDAYRATGTASWEKRDNHFCCQQHGVGCVGEKPWRAGSATSNNELSGWSASKLVDQDENSTYSSNPMPSAQNTNGAHVAVYLPGRPAGGYMVGSVKLHARMVNQKPAGFPVRYRLLLTNPDNTGWKDFGVFTVQPDGNGIATIGLPRLVRTFGAQIIPEEFGKDDGGGYYLQMNEIELMPTQGGTSGGQPPPPQPPTSAAYNLGNAVSNNTLAGWNVAALTDHQYNTTYSSNPFPTTANNNGTFVAAWINSPSLPSVRKVKLAARMMNGVPQGFPGRYRIYLTSPDNSSWVEVGEFGVQPDAQGIAVVTLPQTYGTWGIQFVPTVIGRDNGGGLYFQLAEIELLP
ncbi:MAG: DUF5722 domain-containing protein [Pseudomonadota bacterium]